MSIRTLHATLSAGWLTSNRAMYRATAPMGVEVPFCGSHHVAGLHHGAAFNQLQADPVHKQAARHLHPRQPLTVTLRHGPERKGARAIQSGRVVQARACQFGQASAQQALGGRRHPRRRCAQTNPTAGVRTGSLAPRIHGKAGLRAQLRGRAVGAAAVMLSPQHLPTPNRLAGRLRRLRKRR